MVRRVPLREVLSERLKMNYEELDEAEVNQAIANILGFRFVKVDTTKVFEGKDERGKPFRIECRWYAEFLGEDVSGYWQTRELADEHAVIPDYAEDANEALTLTVDEFHLEIGQRDSVRGKWVAQYMNKNAINAAVGWAETVPLAICRARLVLYDLSHI